MGIVCTATGKERARVKVVDLKKKRLLYETVNIQTPESEKNKKINQKTINEIINLILPFFITKAPFFIFHAVNFNSN